MRFAVLLTILAIVTISLAEQKDVNEDKNTETKDKDTKNDNNPEKTKDTEKGKDAGKGEEKYTDRYDNINVNELTANRRLLVPYLKCVLEKGRCTPEGKELKDHVEDAMKTGCQKCTDKQKAGARQVINHIRETEHIYWEELQNKLDPERKYEPIYMQFLAGKDSQ